MENVQTPTLYTAWREATEARMAFYNANVDNWTAEVAVTYRELAENAGRLYYDYLASATGRPSGLLSQEINDRIHSARD